MGKDSRYYAGLKKEKLSRIEEIKQFLPIYTHSYLGCGIKMYMNGNIYTYNQIKSMGFN